MFENLTDRLSTIARKLQGKATFTESNIEESLGEVRKALLEADVALEVVKAFIAGVKEKAIGQAVTKNLQPGQALIKIVHDELISLMGEANESLNLTAQPPVVVLMAGLQGSGKTTSVAKLAKFLQEKQQKKVLVTSADVYRPAAIEQLATVAKQVNADYLPSTTKDKPIDIAKAALKEAKNNHHDVVIIDTAGRLHIDDEMMNEIKQLHSFLNPTETLFVVDSMTGQDAANTAKAFNDALNITGVILTKTDGDARGGAALSVRHITQKPIKFMGVGEKLDALEPFHPERIASRILGMGDVLTLIEQAQTHIDEKQAKKTFKKMQRGTFNLQDFKDQLLQLEKMGGMAGLLDKLPMPGMNSMLKDKLDNKKTAQLIALIDSMTPHERNFPDVIRGSRKKRIVKGAGFGTDFAKLNQLLSQFKKAQKMMKKFSGKGQMQKMMQMMQNMPGGGPKLPF